MKSYFPGGGSDGRIAAPSGLIDVFNDKAEWPEKASITDVKVALTIDPKSMSPGTIECNFFDNSSSYAHSGRAIEMRKGPTAAIRILMVGMGQVMLQNNPWTGALFLLGLALDRMEVLAAALIGTICSTLTALLLRFDQQDIGKGLYGFNGALVGLAVSFYYLSLGPDALCLIVIGAAASSLLMKGFLHIGIPAYTAPFVLVTWTLPHIEAFPEQEPTIASSQFTHFDILSAVLKGIGQVMFQDSFLSGSLFLIGLTLSSWRVALWALIGSTAGMLTALAAGYPLNAISAGLLGYNAALCGIALARKYSVYPLLAIILSVFVTQAMSTLGKIVLTAPFVLSTWAVLVVEHLIARRLSLTVKSGSKSE